MEVSIPANEVNTQNIYFADKKKNIIVDGDFIKILYSTESFEMNGLYIFVELEQQYIHSGHYPTLSLPLCPRSGIARTPSRVAEQSNFAFSYLRRSDIAPALHKSSSSDSFSFAPGQMCLTPFHIADAQSERCKDTLQCSSNDDQANWIQITSNRNNTTKRVILFNPMSLENIALINRLCQIEQNIIERYIRTYCPFKTTSYILKNQLMNGIIKYHSENVHIGTKEQHHQWFKSASFDSIMNMNCPMKPKERFILKISGVWETATNVGITMKFILVR